MLYETCRSCYKLTMDKLLYVLGTPFVSLIIVQLVIITYFLIYKNELIMCYTEISQNHIYTPKLCNNFSYKWGMRTEPAPCLWAPLAVVIIRPLFRAYVTQILYYWRIAVKDEAWISLVCSSTKFN